MSEEQQEQQQEEQQEGGYGGRQDFDRSASGRCGVTMSASVEGNAIADVMSHKEGVEVSKFPAMVRIDAYDRLEFDLAEIAEELGEEEFSSYDFEIETSTHYGRMVRLDDRVLLFADPGDAAEYLGFDLPEVEEGEEEEEPTMPS